MKVFKPIISSLLETDFYKFTMWQLFLHQFPSNEAVYKFKCRTPKEKRLVDLASLKQDIEEQLDHLCSLRFSSSELDFLRNTGFFKPDFIEFLRNFKYNRDFIEVRVDENGELCIEASGPQTHVCGFEIPVLAIVNELYFQNLLKSENFSLGHLTLVEKINRLGRLNYALMDKKGHDLQIFDFGLRRRASGDWQREVLQTIADQNNDFKRIIKGTSNVLLAKEFGLKPIGTMAHEYLQTFQAAPVQLKLAQKEALNCWIKEYNGDLAIALTDVISMDAFLTDFDKPLAKVYDGLRHDSGCPFEWTEKAIAHYQKMGIPLFSKKLVYSNELKVSLIEALTEKFDDKINLAFGWGTNLTNDLGIPSLSIVMKLVSCNSMPVAKLSDDKGKTMCEDEVFINYLKKVYDYK